MQGAMKERNTTIPVSRTETFYTAHDNQSKVVVEIINSALIEFGNILDKQDKN